MCAEGESDNYIVICVPYLMIAKSLVYFNCNCGTKFNSNFAVDSVWSVIHFSVSHCEKSDWNSLHRLVSSISALSLSPIVVGLRYIISRFTALQTFMFTNKMIYFSQYTLNCSVCNATSPLPSPNS